MKPIDFTKYPKVLPYVKDIMDKSFFRPFEYNPLDEETFIAVVEKWIDKFEKDIDNAVENTYLVYGICNEDTGYHSLSENWTRINTTFKRERRISKDLIREWWTKHFIACISHFYQAMMHSKQLECKGGATGCMITCSFTVRLHDSEYKRAKYNVVSDFNMYLRIENSLHTEIEMYEL